MSRNNRENRNPRTENPNRDPKSSSAETTTKSTPSATTNIDPITGGGTTPNTTHLPTQPLTPEQIAECGRLNLAVMAHKKALLEAQRAWFKDPRNPFAGVAAYDPDSPYLNEAYQRYVDLKCATTTPKQHQANRSTGPRTPEGKAKSARNAFRHGFASAQVILDATEVDAYHAHLDSYATSFQPINQPEADAVRRMADAQWRMDIFKTTESTLVELETEYQCLMLIDPDKIANLAGPWQLRHYRTLSFIDITQERAWDLIHRYHADAAREYSRAFGVFRKLKEMRNEADLPPGAAVPPETEPEISVTEPEPIAESIDEEIPQTQQVRNELPRQRQPQRKSRRLNLGRLVR